MRSRHRIDSSDERYFDALDEARANVRVAQRDYHDALDDLEKLESVVPD